jgi:hypothetical protein
MDRKKKKKNLDEFKLLPNLSPRLKNYKQKGRLGLDPLNPFILGLPKA